MQSSDQQDWDLWLPFALMANQSVQQEATDNTPARMMSGHEMRLPLDLATGRPPGEKLPGTAPEFDAEFEGRWTLRGDRWRVISG